MRRSILLSLLLLPLAVAAAGQGLPQLRVLAIGDSMLIANEAEATPAWVADSLRSRGYAVVVENRSVGGACLRGCGDTQPIGDTFVEGRWTHVLLSGGGNDVIDDGCGPADRYLSADLRDGLLVDLLDRVTGGGARVLLVGYPLPSVETSSFWCPSVQTLMGRYEALARQRDDVEFVDGRQIMRPEEPAHYQDQIHPSVLGSQLMGTQIARRLEEGL